ncbi:hypothetical protein C8C85_3850 [Flavobacterium sp. 103]|uniref:hypothetical protein n=1 Tax=Flavobacterium sp. 103 TaxID=2135624 RepID=UPI000D5E2B76|nr:hypothetical protein [Flavobacterium sp. 103]PVX47886.1 hypothetical protein C8C85_3850 [Flavobacterium sp. 103]
MKPKTTLNLFKNFLAIELKKHLLLFLAFAYEKVSPKPSMLFLASILLLNSSITYSQSSSCKATIQVEKNRFTQSVPPEGTSYTIQISNTGSSNSTYTLSSSNVNSSCSNNDGSNVSGNVNLNVSFSDASLNSISEISLSPGETASFLVNVKVPVGTTVSRWNCTEITATATACSSYKVSTILHTLVSDPNQE